MITSGRFLRVLVALLVAGAIFRAGPTLAHKTSPVMSPVAAMSVPARTGIVRVTAGTNGKESRKDSKKGLTARSAIRLAKADEDSDKETDKESDEPLPIEIAVDKARKGDADEAYEAAKKVPDPVARTLVTWILIRGGTIDRDYRAILEFAKEHPHWPSMGLIRKRAESALLRSSPSPEEVFAFFSAQDPTSTKGRIAWAEAYLARNNRDRAGELIRQVWQHSLLSESREKEILETFGDLIGQHDHRQRYANLLFQSETKAGLRAAERVGGDDLALAKAWVAHLRDEDDAGEKLDAVPESMKGHPGFLLSLLQHLRRDEDRLKDALIVLEYMPTDSRLLGAPDKWWEERREIARLLLDKGDARGAYKAASGPLPASPVERVEADFLAGWIALRFAGNPDLARMHFERLRHDVTTPQSTSRAWYWLGRAHEALGETEAARRSYEKAAKYNTVFYGQLAMSRIGKTRIVLAPPPQPSPEERAAFASSEVVRAARLLVKADERDYALRFASLLCNELEKPTHLTLLAELVTEIGDPRHVVRIGKKATRRNQPLDVFAFPTGALPTFKPLVDGVDLALVYAVARQESLFNPGAKSHVGARGLMQLMPRTARWLAKLYDQKYSLDRLTSEPAYNLQLGTAFLSRLLTKYRGSFIMTFAAYNAGGSRVQDWVEKHGDPRTGAIEPADWIELIPFTETRNYVQRVTENMQVYRSRFNGGIDIDFEADLKRGAPES